MRRVHRILLLLLWLSFAIGTRGSTSAPDVAAADAATSAATTAVLLADLEIAADFATLYDLLHPDAVALVPFAAMAGWYADEFLPRGPGPIEVLDVRFVDWTWPVTGVTYPWTAEVAYRQGFWDDGAETVVETVVHLVETGGGWRWFFGAGQDFLAAQTARFTGAADLASVEVTDPTTALYADLDAFWSGRFAAGGFAYASPGFSGFEAEQATECGQATASAGPAIYCPLDGTIYWETGWRARLRTEHGEYAWTAVIAHEWGHHVQTLLGYSRSLDPASPTERYPIELELQADCLSGAYAQDAEWRGLLVPGDVSAATALAFASGDAAGVAWYEAGAHGTPDMRLTSFLLGYTEGTAGCDFPV